jgi:sugar-specific transcriptional regulator TrmB
MEDELKLLGLNEIDVKIYLTLLKLGESSASDIAIKSETPRASIYDVLERLEKEGFVSHIVKDFKKYFSAAPPNVIIKSLEYKKQKLKDILPELEKIKNTSKEISKAEIYTGLKGLQTILNLVLESKEMFVLGASRKSAEVLPFFMERWHIERVRRKIKVKIIYNDTKEIRESFKNAKDYLKIKGGWDSKFLHTDYLSPIMTIVFGDKVTLITWKKDNPSAILIKNREIAETYKEYILNLWKLAKK